MGPSVRWDDGARIVIPAQAGTQCLSLSVHDGDASRTPGIGGDDGLVRETVPIARPSTALAIISPHILTALRRNARRCLSTCWSTGHPHAVWTTLKPAGHGLVKFSPRILTGLRHKAAAGLSTWFPQRHSTADVEKSWRGTRRALGHLWERRQSRRQI